MEWTKVGISFFKHGHWVSIYSGYSGCPPLISCKKSRYLMIPNRCDTKNVSGAQLEHFIENQVILSTLYLV